IVPRLERAIIAAIQGTRKSPAGCIVSLGDRKYQIAGHPAVVVTEREENVLAAFLKKSVMDSRELGKATGLEPRIGVQIMRRLTKKYGEQFKPAIFFPLKKGSGGYRITVVNAC